MKARGMGLIYQPTWKDEKTGEMKTSTVLWIRYNVRGKRIRENSEWRNRADAARLLKQKLADAQSGKPVGPDVDRTTFSDLTKMIEKYTSPTSAASKNQGADRATAELFHKGMPSNEVTTNRITAYGASRQEAKAANATINRSLAALKRAFRLAERAGKVAMRPYIPMLTENNARSGFLSHAEFMRLRAAPPPPSEGPGRFLDDSGWRVSEMRALEWRC